MASIEDFDENCDGVLLHSENFQALNLLQDRYKEQVKCIYIDPPYNTGNDGFSYKDNYQHSSWLSMLWDRINISKSLLNDYSLLFSSIDDNEVCNARAVLDAIFPDSFETQIIVQSNKRGQTYQKIAKTHEYLLTYTTGTLAHVNELAKANTGSSGFSDHLGEYELWEIRNRNPKFTKANRPNLYYPIYINPHSKNSDGLALISVFQTNEYSIEVFPLNSSGDYSCWRWSKSKLIENIASGYDIVVGKQKRNGEWNIYEKARKETTKAKSVWDETDVISEQGTVRLSQLGFLQFNFPKPSKLIEKALLIGSNNNTLILDFYAGSGTTGDAAISLNRESQSRRKYLLIEMGDHFDAVLKPRLQKVVFSKNWKDGKPQPVPSIKGTHMIEEHKIALKNKEGDELGFQEFGQKVIGTKVEDNPEWNQYNPFNGISHCIKYMRLESYEDALNNLVMPEEDAKLTKMPPALKEDYLLHYMLDVEAEDSLLNVSDFSNPFGDYKLKVKRPGSDAVDETAVDLMETFNYLIGLRVEQYYRLQSYDAAFKRETDPELPDHYDTRLGFAQSPELKEDGKWKFRKIEGWIPANPLNPNDGQKKNVLILWRTLTGKPEEDNLMLDWYLGDSINLNEKQAEYNLIYVNGSNNLGADRKEEDHYQVRLIEEEFLRRMWATEEE